MADGIYSFNKIISIEADSIAANLSATGTGCEMTVGCDEIGTTLFLREGAKESTFCISKGDLASVSYFVQKYPWLLYCGLFAVAAGLVLMLEEIAIFAEITSLIGLILFVSYFFSTTTMLEFESSGGKTISFNFSGSASKKSVELGSFCKSAIGIDKLIDVDPEKFVQSTTSKGPFGYSTSELEEASSEAVEGEIPEGWTKEQWEYYGKKSE